MIIEINAKFPIEWGKEYYSVGHSNKNVYAPCVACDNTGKVYIKGEEYTCPRCEGNWREKEIISTKRVYHVEKYTLSLIEVRKCSIKLRFECKNSNCWFFVDSCNLSTMKIDGREKYLSDDHKPVMAEVKRLNAEEKAKCESEETL